MWADAMWIDGRIRPTAYAAVHMKEAAVLAILQPNVGWS